MNAYAIQALIDAEAAERKAERAKTQMTLGGLIAFFESKDRDAMVPALTNPDSYRGYYSDLAFEFHGNKISAFHALEICKSAMGKTFEGYKGGDYMMGDSTPVWIASYGECGPKLLAITEDGELQLG